MSEQLALQPLLARLLQNQPETPQLEHIIQQIAEHFRQQRMLDIARQLPAEHLYGE